MGTGRLPLRHGRYELALGHERQGIVGAALLAQSRTGLARKLLAAGGAGPMREEDAGLVGQVQYALMQRAVEEASERVGAEPGP